jgi:hypothetical protein
MPSRWNESGCCERKTDVPGRPESTKPGDQIYEHRTKCERGCGKKHSRARDREETGGDW